MVQRIHTQNQQGIDMNLEQTYNHIVKQFTLRNFLHFDTDEQLSRAANIHAVKTTAISWRRKHDMSKV